MDSKADFYKQLADNMSDMVALHAPDGTYRWVSPSVKRILGFSPEELIGVTPYSLFHPDDQESIRNDTHVRAISGEGNILIRYRIRHADGHYVWFETLTQPITDDHGEVIELHTTSRDVSEHQRLQERLSQNEALYRTGLQSLEEGVIVFNAEGKIITYNPQAADIMGVSHEALTDSALAEIINNTICADGLPCAPDAFPSAVTLESGEASRQVTLGIKHPAHDGYRWLAVNSRPIPLEARFDPDDAAVVMSCSDVTESIERENRLKLWSTVYQHSGEPIAIIDDAGMVLDVNQAFIEVLQGEQPDWIGHPVDRLTENGRSEGLFLSEIWPALARHGHWRGELWIRGADGRLQTTWAAMTRVRTGIIEKTLYTLIMSDFSERINQEATWRFRAGHDPLTHLPNRLLLNDRFSVAANAALRSDTTFACCYLDLDKFKPVNDAFGHGVGDEILQAIAGRLATIIRPNDTIARIGGDEFFMLIVGLESRQAYQQVIDRVAQSVSEPIDAAGQTMSIGVSVGMAMYPDDGQSLETLMAVSDDAMYRVKARRHEALVADK